MSDSEHPDLPEAEEEQQPSAAELEAAGQNSMFGDAPAEPASAPESNVVKEKQAPAPLPPVEDSAQPYRVLARKYRPQTFSELIGQDAMVQTLGNAIKRDRLAHAFLMTGVRGVGKTTTARLIAKALNCIGPDGEGGPTIDPCGQCEPCTAIAEGRHIDVIEMDAASHTGVDDVREIIEAVRYAAVSARYKIYIIDEVHMLSRNAFNALLKTLEEPPAHVKFLFATTEVEKLPVTVLSRTQRFDLRRIPVELLREHYASICEKEGVEAEEEALAMIAAAAEGSVRDGLSILDQAIAHADLEDAGKVSAAKVRDMLGLADKGAQRELLAAILQGDPQALIARVDAQFALGVEPLALMRGMMDITHRITLAQVAGGEAEAPTAEERAAIANWAEQLSPRQLHRLWQLLLKGYEETRAAPDPLVAAQMALLRTMHAADMPDPGDLAKKLEEMAKNGVATTASTGNERVGGTPAPSGTVDWQQFCDTVDQNGHLHMAQTMRDWLRVIEISDAKLVYSLAPGLANDPAPELRDALFKTTGKRWELEQRSEGGVPTLREQDETRAAEAAAELRKHPLVEAAFAAFPEAEMVDEKTATGGEKNWSRRA